MMELCLELRDVARVLGLASCRGDVVAFAFALALAVVAPLLSVLAPPAATSTFAFARVVPVRR